MEWQVPVLLTEDLDDNSRCMKGTNKNHQIKCVALNGKIGEYAVCSIYENRPSPCRKFGASYEDGKHNPRCDEAREKHGLLALTKKDWEIFRQQDQTKDTSI